MIQTAISRRTTKKPDKIDTLPRDSTPLFRITNFSGIYKSDAMERIRIVKKGVPAGSVLVVATSMRLSKESLVGMLGLKRSTIDRKTKAGQTLSQDESERVLGMARLVGQVEAMIEQSGDPKGFDAATWVAKWLDQPLPSLGGMKPAQLMDTAEGQGVVSQLISRMQSGAYS